MIITKIKRENIMRRTENEFSNREVQEKDEVNG